MLNYGMPTIPLSISGEDICRWYIRPNEYDPARRHLHLERRVVTRKKRKDVETWVEIRKESISSYDIESKGFDKATIIAANKILVDLTVNFNLPTGQVI